MSAVPTVYRGLGVVSLVGWLAACPPLIEPGAPRSAADVDPGDRRISGRLEDRSIEFAFDGGQLEFELYRDGSRVEQVVRNRYAVAVTLHWSIAALDNLEASSPLAGTTVLPAAREPLGPGEPVVLAELSQIEPSTRYHRELAYQARFGDPRARPRPYVYALPYPHGRTFAVLQSFHGEFSHRGSNEYAVDFNCPVATPVTATRPGVVVAINAGAQGSGTTPEFLDDRRANFVLIQHDDGTLGEYMHLAPSGVEVGPGQAVRRGQEIGLSGNTGFSSTPHLHFQVMTAADDGIAKRSFPFELAITPHRVSPPILGQRYAAWE
jgi:murein DD-endopeptidase MepM/ murein hydrolase activator NlpD